MIPKRFRELEHRWLVQDNTHRDRYRKGPLFKDEIDLYAEYKQLRSKLDEVAKAWLGVAEWVCFKSLKKENPEHPLLVMNDTVKRLTDPAPVPREDG